MSQTNSIRFIYFDVGGVLLEFEHTRTEIPRNFGLDQVHYSQLMSGVARRRNIGEFSGQELDALFVKEFGAVLPPNYWATGEPVVSFLPIKPMHDFILELAGHYRLGLLTNVSREIYERAQSDFADALYPLVDFEIKIASFEEGVAKPDLEIYRRAIARTNLQANEILFVDDMLENIDAAVKVGMQGLVFETKNPQKSIASLRQLLLS
jgi:HAD superfamily hydrolase (TIGR01509 family)